MAGRGRGRGRGRKRRRECEHGVAAGKNFQNHHPQSPNTIHHQSSQDYPFSPPFSSRGVVLKKPSGKTPNHSSTLRPTLIITLDEDEDDAKPELHHHTDDKEPISEIPGSSSSINGAFEYVHGHWVKIEFAPPLKAILEKYGNITRDTDVKSPYHLSIFLERLCHVYQRLERAKFVDLTCAELQGMISELRLLERRKISVGWILERVEYISQSKNNFQDCQRAKEHEARFDASIGQMEKDLEVYERQVCLLHQKISSTKAELLMHKAKNHQIKQGGGDI